MSDENYYKKLCKRDWENVWFFRKNEYSLKTSSFTRTDGTTSIIGNLDFNQNAIYREYVNKLDTSAFAGQMSMAGIGEVRDLQEVATQSPELADLLGKMNTESYTSKLGLADDLLTEWTKTSNFSDTNNLETVTLEDSTSFSFDISDATRTQLDKIQTLETFSSNKLIQTNLNGDVLTITHGSKSRNYNIVRGQENVLTDGLLQLVGMNILLAIALFEI